MRALSRGVNSRVISAARSRSNKQPSLDESVQYASQMRCLNDMTCRNSSRSSDRSCNFQHQYISRRTLFVEAAEGLDRMSEGIQNGLISIHQYTGLPWWATFAASTVLVRAALLPLARLQIIESRKFAMSVPEISFLVQLLRER
jgi:membrane protein insertase Oxa1/YidC/SpoIIIJ